MADPNTPKPKHNLALDLSVLTEVYTVKATNGQEYPLKRNALCAAVELVRLTKAGKRIDELRAIGPDMSEEQAEEYTRTLDETCRKVWDAPEEIHAGLNDVQRSAILDVFLTLHSEPPPPQGANKTGSDASHEPDPSTMESSPPSSVDSTAAIPGIG